MDRIFEQELTIQDLELRLEQLRTPAQSAEVDEMLRGLGVDPASVSPDSSATRRLREWVGQFNALKVCFFKNNSRHSSPKAPKLISFFSFCEKYLHAFLLITELSFKIKIWMRSYNQHNKI